MIITLHVNTSTTNCHDVQLSLYHKTKSLCIWHQGQQLRGQQTPPLSLMAKHNSLSPFLYQRQREKEVFQCLNERSGTISQHATEMISKNKKCKSYHDYPMKHLEWPEIQLHCQYHINEHVSKQGQQLKIPNMRDSKTKNKRTVIWVEHHCHQHQEPTESIKMHNIYQWSSTRITTEYTTVPMYQPDKCQLPIYIHATVTEKRLQENECW